VVGHLTAWKINTFICYTKKNTTSIYRIRFSRTTRHLGRCWDAPYNLDIYRNGHPLGVIY